MQRLLESVRKPFGNWKPPEPAVALQVTGTTVGQLSALFIQMLMSEFPTPEEGQHLVEKNKELELHTTQEKGHFRQQVSRLHEASQSHREEMGTGTKASVSLASCQKKERLSQRDLYWAEALLCQYEKNGLFWEFGNPQLTAGGRNSRRAFLPGQNQEQVRLLSDTPSYAALAKEVGFSSSLSMRQVSNKL